VGDLELGLFLIQISATNRISMHTRISWNSTRSGYYH
jgi:hypothetical protein